MISIDLKEVYGNGATGIPVTGRQLVTEVRIAYPAAPMWRQLDSKSDTFEMTLTDARVFCWALKKRVQELKEWPNRYNQNTNSGFFLFLGAMIRSAEYIPLLRSLYWELQGDISGEELEEDIPPASE